MWTNIGAVVVVIGAIAIGAILWALVAVSKMEVDDDDSY